MIPILVLLLITLDFSNYVSSFTPTLRSSGYLHTRSLRMTKIKEEFDYLVIGGGSGGMATARRAAGYGARVGLVEKAAMGGTCVNVGCVPKKVMFNTATTAEIIHQSKEFGFDIPDIDRVKLDWQRLKKSRDDYVKRLNNIYVSNLSKSNVSLIHGTAEFVDKKVIKVNDQLYSGKHIVIAVGGKPSLPSLPGIEHCITSDGFFQLTEQPKSVAVIGGGYIGVELAGIFNSLGSETTLFTRSTPLHSFDHYIVSALTSEMKKQGLSLVTGAEPTEVIKDSSSGLLYFIDQKKQRHGPFQHILFATGRRPNIEPLHLQAAGVSFDQKRGIIPVNDFQETNVQGVYAIGDAAGKVPLTPMAIAAGRRLADR